MTSPFGSDPKKKPMERNPAGQPDDREAEPAQFAPGASSLLGSSGQERSVETIGLADRSLGEFRILRRLGKGGMAEVYLAEQTSLHRHVAVKVLRPELLSDEVHLERFKREAEAAGGLNHANIVQVYTVGQQDGVHYIAQEYVQGLNLSEFVRRNGPPDAPLAVHIMMQVASALQAAGEAGIVHRDIKPENIMITRKGDVKVTDFGLAQLSRASEGLSLTQDGMTMGTPLYMSPEQVGGSKLDQRSDIYSFGVTCYHMLTGRPPFRGETAFSVALQHVNESAVSLHEQRADLPPALCQIVHKMMAKRPKDRYPDAQAVLADLNRLCKTIGAPAGELLTDGPGISSPRTSPRPRFPGGKRPRRWRLAVALASSCLLAGAVAAVAGWWARADDPRGHPPQPVARRATIQEQFRLADSLGNDEDAWLAVLRFTPSDAELVQEARKRLGLLYLHQLRSDEARQQFDRLASSNDEARRAEGLAGIAVLAALGGDHRRSQEIIANRQTLFDTHLDPNGELTLLLQETAEANRAAMAGNGIGAGQ